MRYGSVAVCVRNYLTKDIAIWFKLILANEDFTLFKLKKERGKKTHNVIFSKMSADNFPFHENH